MSKKQELIDYIKGLTEEQINRIIERLPQIKELTYRAEVTTKEERSV